MRKKKQHPRSACARRTAGVTLDHAAPWYDWLAPLMTLGLEARLQRRVVAGLRTDRPMAALDVGCGTGTLTRQLHAAIPAGPGRRVVGLDAAEAMIAVARRKAAGREGLEFQAALAEELPHADGTFDRAISTFFFHHLNYDLKRRALAELWRILRPGGQAAILDVDIPYSWFGRLCAYSGYWLFRQPEIKENITGRLREALDAGPFRGHWRIASRHSGYLSLFELKKPETKKETT
ncbi:MAG TPA: class I SAM-dependent methyltransferase [Kiritimatiellia bacterium]|nr:class I SAM-dependent methyltransferase [Kiritimatiellia bacterium]HRZ13437.1 class I SAM-dependent methyltransferase [Kiritimatiellia bacterium]HSA18923.1 class I SAM-dependent methyltransferase [Kiritimatiellia bacterium]